MLSANNCSPKATVRPAPIHIPVRTSQEDPRLLKGLFVIQEAVRESCSHQHYQPVVPVSDLVAQDQRPSHGRNMSIRANARTMRFPESFAFHLGNNNIQTGVRARSVDARQHLNPTLRIRSVDPVRGPVDLCGYRPGGAPDGKKQNVGTAA